MADRDPDCLFCRIVAGEVRSERVYEDDRVVAFRDVNPRAPTHVLFVPRRHIGSAADLTNADAPVLSALFAAMAKVATEGGLGDGYRVVTNVGPDAGQSVMHLHFHLLGGRALGWPPG